MQQLAPPQTHTRARHEHSTGRSLATFTQLFAIGAAIFYTALAAATVIAAPELIEYAIAWALWFIVMVAAAATFFAGRHMNALSSRAAHPGSTEQSRRMRRWLK
jgi:hypothetical protein